MPSEQSGIQGQLQDRRSSLRQVLPSGVPASLHLSSGSAGFVTLGDISRAGACVVRRGSLDVNANDHVFLSISDHRLSQNVYLSARVKWMNIWNYKIVVGLAFTEGPVLPGTILDQYLDRVLSVTDSEAV